MNAKAGINAIRWLRVRIHLYLTLASAKKGLLAMANNVVVSALQTALNINLTFRKIHSIYVEKWIR